MRSRLIRTVIWGVVISFLITGCMVSRGVDRAFLGWGVKQPKFEKRKATGILLLPISFALDIVTFPIQAVLVVVFGDDWPYEETDTVMALNNHPSFQKLSNEQKALARVELRTALRSAAVTKDSALVLCGNGHWAVVKINAEQRTQLFARASASRGTLALAR